MYLPDNIISDKLPLEILNTIQEPIAYLNKDYEFIFANQFLCNCYNYKPEDVPGKTIKDLHGKDFFEKIIKPNFDKCLEGNSVSYAALFPFDNNSPERYFEIKYYPRYNKKSEVIGVISVGSDKTEEAIVSTNWLNTIDSLEDIICVIDKDHTIIDINKYGLDLVKKKKEDVIGKKCYHVLHQEDSPRDYCPLRKSLCTKKTEGTEIYEKLFNKFLSIKISPVFDQKGELMRFIAVMRDITAIKEQEKILKNLNEEYLTVNKELIALNDEYLSTNVKLQKLYENYSLLTKFSSDVIAMYDENYKPLYISPSTINFIGYNAAEFADLDIFSIVHPDDKQDLINKISEYKEKGINHYTTTYRIKHRNGNYFWNESVSHIEKDKESGKIVIVVNSRNIDDRKKAEFEARKNEKK
jgi:PAS domain S-box-containing protein